MCEGWKKLAEGETRRRTGGGGRRERDGERGGWKSTWRRAIVYCEQLTCARGYISAGRGSRNAQASTISTRPFHNCSDVIIVIRSKYDTINRMARVPS